MSGLDGSRYMVVIRDAQTGEMRQCDQGEIVWQDSSRYWWMEGNMECDCNREQEFRNGTPVVDAVPVCGSRRYTIEHFVFNPGQPSEFLARPETLVERVNGG